MASDMEGLWPRRTDAASEGVDEDREVDDIDLTLEEDLALEDDTDDEYAVDADERPVELDEDEDRGVEGVEGVEGEEAELER